MQKENIINNKFLQKFYSPEELKLMQDAYNTPPDTTLLEDIKDAYTPKTGAAGTLEKPTLAESVINATWTVLTLPIAIPYNIIKVAAITINHVLDKIPAIRGIKAAIVDVHKYRKANKAAKEPFFSRIKNFFKQLFNKGEKEQDVDEKESIPTENTENDVLGTEKDVDVSDVIEQKPLDEQIKDAEMENSNPSPSQKDKGLEAEIA